MKTSCSPILVVALGLAPAVLWAGSSSPSLATGKITADSAFVRVGVSPTLSWTITHPQAVTDVVTKNPDDTITPKRSVRMDVRVIGADYRHDATRFKPVRLEVRVAGGTWTRIFSGTQTNVRPDVVVHSRTVNAGQKIEFRFQGAESYTGTSWNPYRYGPDQMVVAMVHGERPPSYAPYLSKNSVASYLTPYMAADGTMDLGPRDIIYLTELTNTNTSAAGFDLQDLVVMVTVTEI